MPTSNRLVFPHLSRNESVASRTAVYGPVRTVVWQGSAGDRRPYADQVGFQVKWLPVSKNSHISLNAVLQAHYFICNGFLRL